MIHKPFEKIQLSTLGMGCMRLPTKEDGSVDYGRAQEIIDYAMANAVNYYDTAYVYHGGESERFLGEAMQAYARESYNIATKFFIQANPDYKAVFEEQLRRLQTDHVDFYLIHGVLDHTADEYVASGCIHYFMEQKRSGRIRYLGFSSHASPEVLDSFAGRADWDFAQIQLNYYDWKFGPSKQEYEVLKKHGLPIVVMEPTRGGKLCDLPAEAAAMLKTARPDLTPAAWAFRWLKRLDGVQVVLSGMSTIGQMVENVATFSDDAALTDEEEAILMQACEHIAHGLAVPCTGCRYCTDGCPMQIEIPRYMNIYNKFKSVGLRTRWEVPAVKSKGRSSDCIACGACTSHCPQHIDIPKYMKEIAIYE